MSGLCWRRERMLRGSLTRGNQQRIIVQASLWHLHTICGPCWLQPCRIVSKVRWSQVARKKCYAFEESMTLEDELRLQVAGNAWHKRPCKMCRDTRSKNGTANDQMYIGYSSIIWDYAAGAASCTSLNEYIVLCVCLERKCQVLIKSFKTFN